MSDRSKRILWLINHTTLRQFEVPLLRSLGYEVFLPKVFPQDEANRSASVDYSFDSCLTISAEQLATLNEHDFYNGLLSPAVKQILNEQFETAIIAFFPTMLGEITKHFKGKILLRAFGLAGDTQYASVLQHILGVNFLSRLPQLTHRFWFAQAYDNLAEIEPPYLKSRAIFLPLGLPDAIRYHEKTWVGNKDKILFICPRINSSPSYYGKIYREFKTAFGDLPHLIGGAQPISVADSNVTGFQPREQFDEWLCALKVMFYHSQEPRHLHYHPLEAIAVGMPLIYMKTGLLGRLGGDDQPGACATMAEARKKIERILSGDRNFINEVREKQQAILQPFTYEVVKKAWEENFPKKAISSPQSTKPKKIAVFLPIGYRGGSLNGAKNLAKMLHLGSRFHSEPVDVVFSCVANFYNINEDFADLLELGISIRETEWKTVSQEKIVSSLVFGMSLELDNDSYLLPTDQSGNFADCDFWLVVSDRTLAPIAPIKPYGMMIYDYIQRYLPHFFGGFFERAFFTSARRAQFVLTTTPNTRDDAIQYAGVASDHVHVIPMEFNPFKIQPSPSHIDCDYFIWTTNSAMHKNHFNAIEALDIYYQEYGGQLDVVITGVDTELFNLAHEQGPSNGYVQQVRNLLEAKPLVKKHLRAKGNLSTGEYISILSSAKFLWHPTLIDNGTYAVIEAAYYGTPSLSSNYPQMKFIDERFKLGMTFCQAAKPREMALHLKKMEETYTQKRQQLPNQEHLNQFSYAKIAPEFWSIIRGLI